MLDLGDIETFLSRAPEPPSLPAVSEAVAQLRELRALDVAREALTPLGKHLATLPVDVSTPIDTFKAKMSWIVYKCLRNGAPFFAASLSTCATGLSPLHLRLQEQTAASLQFTAP